MKLFEWLLVIAICAALAALIASNVNTPPGCPRIRVVVMNLHMLSQKAAAFYLDTATLPSALSELHDSQNQGPDWRGPYVRPEQLFDPWGRPFKYRLIDEARGFAIGSLGRDGVLGGEDHDADEWLESVQDWDQ